MHFSPDMWRLMPAFWMLGALAIASGLPLMLRRVRPNPYFGATIGESGQRPEIWYDVNRLLGRDLSLAGVRTVIFTTGLALLDWRHPQHYLFVSSSVLVAQAMFFAARWRQIAIEVRALGKDGAPTQKES